MNSSYKTLFYPNCRMSISGFPKSKYQLLSIIHLTMLKADSVTGNILSAVICRDIYQNLFTSSEERGGGEAQGNFSPHFKKRMVRVPSTDLQRLCVIQPPPGKSGVIVQLKVIIIDLGSIWNIWTPLTWLGRGTLVTEVESDGEVQNLLPTK
jgi:hypothetical protein